MHIIIASLTLKKISLQLKENKINHEYGFIHGRFFSRFELEGNKICNIHTTSRSHKAMLIFFL